MTTQEQLDGIVSLTELEEVVEVLTAGPDGRDYEPYVDPDAWQKAQDRYDKEAYGE